MLAINLTDNEVIIFFITYTHFELPINTYLPTLADKPNTRSTNRMVICQAKVRDPLGL